MWVKICGNTRLEDCLHAAACGADAVGFVFAPGKRTVTAEQVKSITRQLPAGLETIGVFSTGAAFAIAETALEAGLTGVQLHREYDAAQVRTLRAALDGKKVHIIQVVFWEADLPAASQIGRFRDRCAEIAADCLADRLLVDTRMANHSGGMGVSFDWAAAAAALTALDVPLIIAGGLRPQNVVEAVRRLRPLGVDVSSGVEEAPGVKDAAAIRSFIRNARAAG